MSNSEYLKSAIDVLDIAKDAGKVLLANTLGRFDNWLCDYGNEDEDGES